MMGRSLCLGCTVAILWSTPSFAQTMEERAQAAANASRAKSADSETISRNYLTPGLSGGTIATVDGSRNFATSLACQKSATMVEIMVQPGRGGDITHLSISRDRDLDGRFDSSLTVPSPVSGICANGVIACVPGSWNSCRSFKWGVNGTGDVALTEVDMPELSGCYCVNGSCGSDLVLGNLASVLSDLGGGVIGAITTADPRIGVAQASIEGPVIRYVGAQTSACTSNPTVAATVYASNPSAIQGDAAAASATSSIFTALAASPAGSGKAQETRACTIEREINVSEPVTDRVIARSGGLATIQVDSATVRFQMGSPASKSLRGGSCSIFEFRMTLTVGEVDRLRSAILRRYFADDWAQIYVDGQLIASGPQSWTGSGLPPGRCEKKAVFTRTPGTDLLPMLTAGTHEIRLRVAVADEGETLAEIEAKIDDSCTSSERLVDLCQGYAAQPNCRLVQESVDGVATVRNGVNTGLKPLPVTRLFGTGRCTYQYTRDFFLRDRRYACVTDSAALAKPDLSRGAYIIDRSTETMLADQTRSADGTLTRTARTFALPERPPVAACEALCKTRAPKANSGVAPDGAVATKQNDPSGWDSFYHVCSAASVCPLGAGEEIVTPCGCIDDFPEAVVMMQTVRLAGSDLACMAGTR